MVEHRLAKARVASSNLVSRSNPPSDASRIGYGGMERTKIYKAALPRRGTQVVRERSAKPLCAGSIPARASNLFNYLQANSSKADCATVGTFVGTTCISPRFRLHWVIVGCCFSKAAIC